MAESHVAAEREGERDAALGLQVGRTAFSCVIWLISASGTPCSSSIKVSGARGQVESECG
jgi:hypothetical protein